MNIPQPQSFSGLYTSCPTCLRQFRIYAEQLSASAGQVKCGICGQEFNALNRLHDTPLTIEQMQNKYDPATTPQPDQEHKDSQTDKISKQVSQQHNELLNELTQDLTDKLPEKLHTHLKTKTNKWVKIGWTLSTGLLIAIITVQLAWFNRDTLLQHYPKLLPIAKELCNRLDCNIWRHRDINSIKLLNRDVRHHPLYVDSLLINATIVNQAKTLQPFPLIQLALFDTNGKIIAYSEFKPEEYLRRGNDMWFGMTPELPIHIMLEVSGTTQDAVGFEFNFI